MFQVGKNYMNRFHVLVKVNAYESGSYLLEILGHPLGPLMVGQTMWTTEEDMKYYNYK